MRGEPTSPMRPGASEPAPRRETFSVSRSPFSLAGVNEVEVGVERGQPAELTVQNTSRHSRLLRARMGGVDGLDVSWGDRVALASSGERVVEADSDRAQVAEDEPARESKFIREPAPERAEGQGSGRVDGVRVRSRPVSSRALEAAVASL
jgi:hypothetical protein